MAMLEYPVIISPIPLADGGGFAAVVPDLPGCMSDGETPEEAIANVGDAISEWIATAVARGVEVPTPTRHNAIA
jgi:antitoxin HicB